MNLRLDASLLAGLMVCSGSLLVPSVAEACSCFGETRVAQRQELAENAQLLLGDFCGGSENEVSVTVDGQPATLTTGGSTGFEGTYLRAIDPPISAGQAVVVDFGEFSGTPTLTLVVAGPDTEPPLLDELTLEVETGIVVDEGCSGDVEPKNRMNASIPVDPGDDDVLYTFAMYFDGQVVSERSVARFGEQSTVGTRFVTDVDPNEVCVDVTAVDAAGNESEVLGDCVEGPGAEDSAGCGCTADGEDGDGWLALALLGVLGLVRRRLA